MCVGVSVFLYFSPYRNIILAITKIIKQIGRVLLYDELPSPWCIAAGCSSATGIFIDSTWWFWWDCLSSENHTILHIFITKIMTDRRGNICMANKIYARSVIYLYQCLAFKLYLRWKQKMCMKYKKIKALYIRFYKHRIQIIALFINLFIFFIVFYCILKLNCFLFLVMKIVHNSIDFIKKINYKFFADRKLIIHWIS